MPAVKRAPKMAKKIGGRPAEKKRPTATPVSSERRDSSGPSSLAEKSFAAEKTFPIVGVGASAGGLEAFTQLLEHLPSTTGMAFVLIQHLDPTHTSQLPEILSRKSTMPIREVQGDTPVKSDHVYVIPASENLRIEKGILRTMPRPVGSSTPNMAVDEFLKALARDRGKLAFGIVLSGTASDGTIGLKAIKAEGGITFAQEPSSAKFDGMPSSAIAAGAVDFVLPPEAIAQQLVALSNHPYLTEGPPEESESEVSAATNGDIFPIFGLLRSATGIDFTHYKHNTILRRIERRMALHGIETVKDYSRKLRHDRAEAKILAQEFLINVTAFFREPEAFEALRELAFPALIENRSVDDPIRVWIPGCSTGEEAYSLAIALTEFLDANHCSIPIQIFATDLSDMVIEKARAGFYLENALSGVSPERLQRFFIKRERIYQISQAIRNICVFAKQDLTKDPPFSKLDLISCCNLLIYLGPVLQKKAISVFHYALKPGGFLVLGSSESLGSHSESFQVVDRKQRIFSKHRSTAPIGSGLPTDQRMAVPYNAPLEGANPLKNIQRHVDRMLLAEYAPAGVIIDDSMHVLQVRGETGHYLQIPSGEPTTDLTRLLRPGLLAGVRSAIRKARQQGTQVRESGLRVKSGDKMHDLELRVSPIHDPNSKEPCFLILFDELTRQRKTPASARGRVKTVTSAKRAQDEVQRLEEELRATRDYLQSIIESQEAASEELRSANEEAQATNEELDTAKEELQASNEELNTVNDELRARNLEQSTLNSDLRKLLESINVPLVMVGKDLRIRWFTPAIEPLLNLLPTDQGRPVTDLQSSAIPNFRELLMAALAGEQGQNIEIQNPAGRWQSLRILPYRGPANAIEGAIATLIDIDDLKRARDFAEAVVGVVREPLIVLDAALRVRTANRAFYQVFQVEAQDIEGRLIYEVGGGQWNIPKLRQLLEEILPKHKSMMDFQLEQNYMGIGTKTMVLHAREIRHGDHERLILLAIDDITELRQFADNLRKTNEDLKQFIYAASHDLQEPIRMIVSYTDLLNQRFGDKLGKEGGLFINYAVEGAQRLEALIAGLREFWQLSERVDEQPASVDCNEVLQTVLLNLEKSIAESGAVITADPLPSVLASAAPLIQLFQNLIGNAIKYRSDQPPRISISATKSASAWLFSIADNGQGIDPKYAVEVFRVFKRLHSRGKYPGTGIGLAICQKIVERYGGRIWVEANPSGGSIFKFTIPDRSA
jgi:two-component system CheB/CheR fusion protein